MRCRLLLPGGLRDKRLRSLCDEYLKRAGPTFRCEQPELKAAKGYPAAEARKREAKSLEARVDPRAFLFVLDERGKQLTTDELATQLSRLRDTGRRCDFIVGSAHGLDRSIIDRADRLLGLSALTLPHEMAAMLLAEQLYRAASILRGEPYHRGG